MYPGYSPADHIYGEAAAEYGAIIAEARRQGKEVKTDPSGIEYVVGQNQLSAREQLEAVKESFAAKKAKQNVTPSEAERDQGNGEPMEGVEQTADVSQLFMVDANPTPVSVLQNMPENSSSKGKNKANDKAKRSVSLLEDQANAVGEAPEDSHQQKRVKTAKAEEATIEPKPLVEEDDISAEVDRRLKEKEERRRRKMEKKRKRESDSSQVERVEIAEGPVEETRIAKPDKKKHKKDKRAEEAKQAELVVTEEEKHKKDKKKKKRQSIEGEAEGEESVIFENEKPKTKRKKESKELSA
jgi:hypothetical protein